MTDESDCSEDVLVWPFYNRGLTNLLNSIYLDHSNKESCPMKRILGVRAKRKSLFQLEAEVVALFIYMEVNK